MLQEQKLAEDKLQKQREEWEQQVREMNEKMREKEDEIKSQMQSEGDLDKRRLAEQLAHQESKLAEELVKAEILFERKQHELMEKQRELESSLQKQMREAMQLSQQKDRERLERIRFDDQLLHSIPLINEANSIGEELQRQAIFALQLITCWPPPAALSKQDLSLEDDEALIAQSISADLKVQVKFQEAGTFRSVMWDADQFHSNVYIMREMYQVFIENNRTMSSVQAWKEEQESDCDPFYEPPQPQLIGKSYVFLNSIEFGCKISETVPIFDHRGLSNGSMKCEITPTVLSHEWQALQHRLVESCPEDTTQLQLPTLADFLGSNLRVNILVDRLRGIPGKLCKDVHVVIKWIGGAEEEYTSPPAASPTVDPQIDFSILIERTITPDLIAYVTSFPLEFSVYGIVPSSNLNSVAAQAVDINNDMQSNSFRDELDDPNNSVTFFDVDAHGKNKIMRKKKSMRRRNGKLLSDEEDATTLLEKCQDQLAVQGRLLVENTQELEHKTHEVNHLQHKLTLEMAEKERLHDTLESLVRTNKLLQTKLEQQILKQSVAKFAPDRKKTTAAAEIEFSLRKLNDVAEHESGSSDRETKHAAAPKEDIDTLAKRAVFEEVLASDASSLRQKIHLPPVKETTSVHSDRSSRVHQDDANKSNNTAAGQFMEQSGSSHHDYSHAVQGEAETKYRIQTDVANNSPVVQNESPPNVLDQTTDTIVEIPSRVKQKGLFHAVFSVQHRGKKSGCPVS